MRPIDLATDETVTFVLAHIGQPPLRILDVGCGTGLVASRLQVRGYEVVAIDESAELVQQTRGLGVDAHLATWPSFVDTPFDVVLFARSLHHIQPLAAAVEHAHRLLVPSGLAIVDDFAWAKIDPVTAEWFYSVVKLLTTCQVLMEQEDSFATELVRSGGEFAFWEQSHDRDLHTVTAMWSALQSQFQSLSQSSAPYLYRYLCPVVAENEAGYAIVSEVRSMEQRLAHLGMLTLIGRRFVGRKR
jgi:SAM-dependent methyltransferase